MTPLQLLRQSDLLDNKVVQATKITIIGAGAVGSWVTLALAKMGYSDIEVWDYDTIDDENIGNQFYPINSVGQPKLTALASMVYNFSGTVIKVKPEEYKGQVLDSDIVIAAVDNMGVRLCAAEHARGWFIDPRMGAESMMMYTYDMRDKTSLEKYKAGWYSDDDAEFEACTAKATMYCANILAGYIACNVKKLTMGEDYIHPMIINLPECGVQVWKKELS